MELPGKGWRKAPDGSWVPPNQMKYVIEVEEDTQEWLSEELDGLKKAFVVGKTARSIGETAKGILSHPVGFAAVATPIIATLIALFVKPDPAGSIAGRDIERELALMMMSALPVSEEARQQATDNLLGAIRTIRKLLGLELPPPPSDGEGGAPSGGGAG